MKTWVMTPCFCKSGMLEEFLEHVYRVNNDSKDFTHVLIDQHYPVDIENNRRRIKELADQYGCTYVDSGGDVGLQKGLNQAMEKVGVSDKDVLIGCDADDRPSYGWVQTLRDVMLADPKMAVACAIFWVIDQRMTEKSVSLMNIGKHLVWKYPGLEMWNIAAFNTKFIREIGGFRQPNEYYGGIECALYPEWMSREMHYGYVLGVRSDAVSVDRNNPNLYDPQYGEWKLAHATKGYKGSFGEWLKDGYKSRL